MVSSEFFGLFYFQHYFCFLSFVLSDPTSSQFANPVDSVRQALLFAAVEGHRQAPSSVQTIHNSPSPDWAPAWRSCKVHLVLSLPLSHKAKEKSGRILEAHGLFQLWWSDPGKKHWKLPSKDQKNLQRSCCSTSSFSLEEEPCREQALTPPCSLSSAFICGYPFHCIFTYFHVSKSHPLQ